MIALRQGLQRRLVVIRNGVERDTRCFEGGSISQLTELRPARWSPNRRAENTTTAGAGRGPWKRLSARRHQVIESRVVVIPKGPSVWSVGMLAPAGWPSGTGASNSCSSRSTTIRTSQSSHQWTESHWVD